MAAVVLPHPDPLPTGEGAATNASGVTTRSELSPRPAAILPFPSGVARGKGDCFGVLPAATNVGFSLRAVRGEGGRRPDERFPARRRRREEADFKYGLPSVGCGIQSEPPHVGSYQQRQPLTPALSPCCAKGEGEEVAGYWLRCLQLIRVPGVNALLVIFLISILSTTASAHTASLTRVEIGRAHV